VPAAYRVTLYRDAAKDLGRVHGKAVERIIRRIGALHGNSRPSGCEKLSSLERYRIRQGDWRTLFEFDDKKLEVNVVKIANRKDVYR
jgi:mRNA interferase RelE/StbE